MKQPEELEINKKLNTVLFTLGAVIVFSLMTMFVFIVLFSISVWAVSIAGESVFSWVVPVIFILSITVSFFMYNGILNIIFKNIEIDDYFDPIAIRWRR
ncbi:MAG: hypothetical protein LBD20_06020 [Spirochaetaceae bacterium]|jgi:hypothetical protein|nr:hypothetical protein [Spirochaetaceae bacterium]